MANKQVNQLVEKDKPEGDDLVPIHDSSEAGLEKLKHTEVQDFNHPKWHPDSPSATGVKPGMVVNSNITIPMVNMGAPVSAPRAYVSAADIIISVIHNETAGGGGPPYLYGIRKIGGTWSNNIDPRKAFIQYACIDGIGPKVVEVRVQDTSGNWTYTQIACNIQDPDSLCP